MSMDEKYPLALPEGTILAGQYMIEKVLGQGGFGITYRATDHKTNQKVAVKEFFPDTLAYRERKIVISYPGERSENYEYGKESFLQEAKTLAEFIGNVNIVRIHSYFEENGTAYFVMDYIEGKSFDEYIKERGGKISVEEARNILVPVMDALGIVHSRGIIHRDVTPDNIFITNEGTVKLLDFGAARYSLGDKSRSLDVILKHGFAPKEQYTRRGKQGPFTDIYSLGATFYFAVTGKRPPDSVDRLDEDDLIPPSNLGVNITEYQERAILQALSVQPAERFQSIAEFKKVLLNESSATNQIFFTAPDANAAPVSPEPPIVQQVPSTVQQAAQQVQSEQMPLPTQQAVLPVQTGQSMQDAQKQGNAQNKKLIIGLCVACGVFALVIAFLIGNAFSNKNDVTTSGGGSVNQENSSQSSGSYADNSTTATPEPATVTPEPATPEPVTYDVSELVVVGNTAANIKNQGKYTEWDGIQFYVNENDHSLYFAENGYIYRNKTGNFSCLSYYNGILYFLYNGKAYMRNMTEDTAETLIPELEAYSGNIQSLYVTTGCYFIYTDGKLYRISRVTGKEEEWVAISNSRDFTFDNDGYLYYIGNNESGFSMLYKVAASDFSSHIGNQPFVPKGSLSEPVVNGNYVYVLHHSGSAAYIKRFSTNYADTSGDYQWNISELVNDTSFAFYLNTAGNNFYLCTYDKESGSSLLYHIITNSNGFDKHSMNATNASNPYVSVDGNNIVIFSAYDADNDIYKMYSHSHQD